MTELFDIAPSLSPRLRWMQEHDLMVEHIADDERRPHESPYEVYAYWDGEDEDPAPHTGWGETEDAAIIDWAKRNRIPLWNEPQPKTP